MPQVFQNFSYDHPQLIHLGKEVNMKGNWNASFFQNDHSLVLELACGRGEYTIGLAQQYPEKNFIGVDIKGARIFQGAQQAEELGLSNVAFLRTKIERLDYFFGTDEVAEMWITFPDPFPKKESRRLSASNFLKLYQEMMPDGAYLHLKTDAIELFEFSLSSFAAYPHFNLIRCVHDIHSKPDPTPEWKIKTYYEGIHMDKGTTINYARAIKT